VKQTTKTKSIVLPVVDVVDTSYLQTLLGYNARRAALSIIEIFLQRMAIYALRPVDFSVLSVIAHNPGVTSRQLCSTLGILPPNFVAMLANLEKRELVERQPHPSDKRAVALLLTQSGEKLMREAERTAQSLELDASARLSSAERKTLMRLLQKIYLP
jgi:DNA-binding MarR family transcriptional regulator